MQNNSDLSYIPFSSDPEPAPSISNLPPTAPDTPAGTPPASSPSPAVKTKKKLKPSLIIISVLGTIILALATILIYLFATGYFDEAPPEEISDTDFLASQSAWEKLGAPTVIWTFSADGSGELTTNKSNYYKTTWSLSDKQLNITTAWLYQLEDSFELSINRDDTSFTVHNLSTDAVSVFVPLGTSEKSSTPSETATPSESSE